MMINAQDKRITNLLREFGVTATPTAFLAAVDAWHEIEGLDPDLATPAEAELIADLMGADLPDATRQVALDCLRTGGPQSLLRLAKSARTKRKTPELKPATRDALGQGRTRRQVRIG